MRALYEAIGQPHGTFGQVATRFGRGHIIPDFRRARVGDERGPSSGFTKAQRLAREAALVRRSRAGTGPCPDPGGREAGRRVEPHGSGRGRDRPAVLMNWNMVEVMPWPDGTGAEARPRIASGSGRWHRPHHRGSQHMQAARRSPASIRPPAPDKGGIRIPRAVRHNAQKGVKRQHELMIQSVQESDARALVEKAPCGARGTGRSYRTSRRPRGGRRGAQPAGEPSTRIPDGAGFAVDANGGKG